MDNSRPTTSRPMSRQMYEAANMHEGNMQSTRIGTASRLSALPANRLTTSKNIGILQKVRVFFTYYFHSINNTCRCI